MPKETNVKTNGKTGSSQATQLGVDELNPLDAAVAYLIKGPGLRIMLNYLHTDLGMSRVANAVQLGTQGIFF